MKQTVASRIWIGLGAVLFIFLLSNGVVSWIAYKAPDATRRLRAVGDENIAAQDMLKLMVDMETGLRGFLLTGDEQFLEPFNAGRTQFEARLSDARSIARENPSDLASFNAIGEREAMWLRTIAEPQIGARRAAAPTIVAEQLAAGKRTMDSIRDEVGRLRTDLLARREAVANEADERARTTSAVAVTASVLAVLAAAFIGGLTVRDVRRRIADVIYGTTAAATQIAGTVVEQEQTVINLASSVNEVSATSAELNATSQRSAESADMIASTATTALSVSRAGRDAVLETVAEMQRVKEKVEAVAGKVLELSDQIGRIGSLAALMGDFANQTNLLALNAAVEAARAGEHGRGLAVVAGEIRRLADQSKQAAERTRDIVAEIQRTTNATVMATEEGAKRVDSAVTLAEESGQSIQSLEHTIERTSAGVQQIAATAREQATATGQVTLAMTNIDRTMQEIVAATTQTGKAADSLERSAGTLRLLVE